MIPNTTLGIHIATIGGIISFSETIFRASKEKIKTNAREIPIARFPPIPPRFFSEARDNAKVVRIMIATGIEVRW